MVEYTEWTQIGHEVFKQKGGRYGSETAVDVTQTLASYWSENKERLQNMSRSQARSLAQAEINVR